MLSERQIGILWVLLAVIGYAFLPIIVRSVYAISDLQPTDIAIWRFIFATPTIWLVIFLRERTQETKLHDSPAQILRMMSLGIFMTGAVLSVVVGLQYVPASLFIVLFYTYPAMVAIISVVLGQKLHTTAWIALFFTISGVVLTVPDLSLAGDNTLLGMGIAFLNAAMVAIYFVLIARQMPKTSSISRGAAYVITGTFCLLLLLLPVFGLRLPADWQTWGLLFALATWCTAMPIFVINLGIQKIGVTQSSIIATCEPIMTMFLALVILNETILVIQWVGAALIIAGVIILEIRPQKQVISA